MGPKHGLFAVERTLTHALLSLNAMRKPQNAGANLDVTGSTNKSGLAQNGQRAVLQRREGD